MRKALLAILSIGMFASFSSSAFAGGYSYGAIAYSSSTGRYGFSENYCSADTAIAVAIQYCGVPDCVMKTWFYDSCGALAKASNGCLGWSFNQNSPGEAEARALAECEQRGNNCRILCHACSLGHRHGRSRCR